MKITNLHLKIFSVIIAICMWMYIVTGEFQEISLYVPIKLTNIPEGYVAVTGENLVNVLAKGPKSLVKDKQFNKVQISLDVSKMKPGTNSRVINPEDVQMPAGIQVASIEPKSIDITVDSLIKKHMKVIPTFIGEPQEGYKVGAVTVYPESVVVNAAKSKIEGLMSMETMPVNLSGKKDPITYSIGLKFYEGVQDYSPQQVEVFVVFKEDIQSRTVSDISVSTANTDQNLNANVPDTIQMRVQGRVDLLTAQGIQNILNPHVDMTGIKDPGKYKRKIVFRDSKILKVISSYPTKVEVEVK